MPVKNNLKIPSFMYGTAWKKDATTELVKLAISCGFKAIDTANQLIHYNEALVGEALITLEEKGIKREDLFIQTKFTSPGGQDHRTPYDASADIPTQVKQSFNSSLEHLNTDYIDSYLLHGPYSRVGLGNDDWEVWSALEEIYKSGKTKMIGISNVNAKQLQQLCDNAQIKPMIVQNRCYAVQRWDKSVRTICREHDIIYQGFSLLTANQEFLRHPEIKKIAKRLKTTAAQVIFKFSMLIGMLPLTGTTSEQHMQEDLAAESLELSLEESKLIEKIAV